MILDAKNLDHRDLNIAVRDNDGDITIDGCCGQRFIAAGMKDKHITINGIPGNALGAYLDGAVVEVFANAQDAVGDTMNDGRIVVHGSIGDAAGYAMRGGKIYVKGDAGYRAGIHMKQYREKKPIMIIGGCAGSFLGEYQAGGTIIVLGLNRTECDIVGNFPCTGMHGGRVYLRSNVSSDMFPSNVNVSPATTGDIDLIRDDVNEYCNIFGLDAASILSSGFTVISPDNSNPYNQMYVAN